MSRMSPGPPHTLPPHSSPLPFPPPLSPHPERIRLVDGDGEDVGRDGLGVEGAVHIGVGNTAASLLPAPGTTSALLHHHGKLIMPLVDLQPEEWSTTIAGVAHVQIRMAKMQEGVLPLSYPEGGRDMVRERCFLRIFFRGSLDIDGSPHING